MNLQIFEKVGDELEQEIVKRDSISEYNSENHRTWNGDLNRFLKRHVLQNAKKRAKEKNLRFDLSHQEIISMWHHQKGICAGFGVPMEYKTDTILRVSLDQIIAGNGYTIDNVWLTTAGFNYMKNKFNLVEVSALLPFKTSLFEKVYTDYINHRKFTHNSDLILI